MLFEILIAVGLGILAGCITGLIPGIHINLVSLLVLSGSVFLLQYTSPLILVIFIVSMAVTHTFLDFLPSCYLGAPNADTALSVLPAHRLLLKGRGYEAVKLATMGSLFGLIFTLILVPVFLFTVKGFYDFVSGYIAYILILSVFFLVLKDRLKMWALVSFLMAGILGLAVLNIANLEQPLFPMLSGLFGTSTLILSINEKTTLPKQEFKEKKISKKEVGKALGGGIIASSLCGFLPGLGAAQAAILASSGFKKISTRGFLVLLGAINTMVMVISFIALYTIEKSRNGAILVVSKIIGSLNFETFILFLGVSLLVAGIATFLTLKLAKVFSKFISKISYKKTCLVIVVLISVLVLLLSGFLGFFILIVSTFVGMVPALKGIGRNHLMGCLILPVILYFLL